MIFWTAFLLGLAGSLHCVGMCGPLTLALPIARSTRNTMWAIGSIFHLGRILTYVLLGVIFGLLGQVIEVAGFQKYFSIFGGILILLLVFFSYHWKILWLENINLQLQNSIKNGINRILRHNRKGGYFLIGMLNGLIPCGLVYTAIALAVASSAPILGMASMFFFGLGTVPLLFALILFQQVIHPNFRNYLNKFSPVAIGIFGLLLLMRGFSMTIPHELVLWDSFINNVFCH